MKKLWQLLIPKALRLELLLTLLFALAYTFGKVPFLTPKESLRVIWFLGLGVMVVACSVYVRLFLSHVKYVNGHTGNGFGLLTRVDSAQAIGLRMLILLCLSGLISVLMFGHMIAGMDSIMIERLTKFFSILMVSLEVCNVFRQLRYEKLVQSYFSTNTD